jgi:hypothetical protein
VFPRWRSLKATTARGRGPGARRRRHVATPRSAAGALLAEGTSESVTQCRVVGAESADLCSCGIEALAARLRGCSLRGRDRCRRRWGVIAVERNDGLTQVGLVVEPASGDPRPASSLAWFRISATRRGMRISSGARIGKLQVRSGEAEDGREGFVHCPQFLRSELAGAPAETLRVDGAHLLHEHTCLLA